MWSLCIGSVATLLLAAPCASALRPGGFLGNFKTAQAVHGDVALSNPNIRECNFSVPVDHFHNESQYEPHSDKFFPLRYFLDISHYKPGGPVIVIQGGEAAAEYRKPKLNNGIGPLLARATGGVVLVMEHRYYGKSFPVSELSNENYRFLTTEQAVADAAYFAQHVQFPGLEHMNLTAATTPWFMWGGSYGGAYAALTRKLHPDAYWGAISSSGVTKAIIDYWEYAEATRLFAPGDCGPVMGNMTFVLDTALFSQDTTKAQTIKTLFGRSSSTRNDNFASGISHPYNALQGESWVHGQSDTSLDTYCATITSPTLEYPNLESRRSTAEQLVQDAGLDAEAATTLLNYVGLQSDSNDQLSGEQALPRSAQLSDDYSWYYQTCSQWGYAISGSGAPKDIRGIISRSITIDSFTRGCNSTFGIYHPPNVESINRLGGTNFSSPRLAIIDGKQDPWRAATPHKIGANTDRKSTTEEPFILLDFATHHWDEDDVPASEYGPGYPPKQIVDVHNQELAFIKAWIKEFYDSKSH